MKAAKILALTLAAALSGCAGAALDPVGPEDTGIPVQTRELSVPPPLGPHWYRVTLPGQPPSLVLFHKLLPDRARQAARGHTYAVSARASRELDGRRFTDAQAFAAFVTERMAQSDRNDSRHRVVHWRVAPDTAHAPLCVRYEAEIEDRGVPGWGDTPFLITARGYRCVHPFDASVAVDVSASERRLPDDAPWMLDEETQPFVEEFRFRAPR